MRKILAILLLWCSVSFGAYYTFKPSVTYNLNNAETAADSVKFKYWYLDGALIDSHHVLTVLTGTAGVYEVDTTVAQSGRYLCVATIYDASEGLTGYSESFFYDADDTLITATATVGASTIQQIADSVSDRVYDTLYVHADDFKGGTGTGSDLLIVYVLNASDSSAVWPAKVTVNTKWDATGSRYTTTNNGAGLCTFSLDDGDSILMQAVATGYYIPPDSIEKGSGIEVCTLWATGLTIPSPTDPALCTVYGNLRSISGGDSISDAEVVFIWDHVCTDTANGLILGNRKTTVFSDSTGLFQADLFTTTGLNPSGLKWRIEISHSNEFKPSWKSEFEIPADSAGATYDLSTLNYGMGTY